LAPGFQFGDVRIPLFNLQRGIFKPTKMKYLLSIKTVFPRPGGRVWYDDQREVHRQIFADVGTIEYAFLGSDPNASDNRWLRGGRNGESGGYWTRRIGLGIRSSVCAETLQF
jgi:putative restriction endonuclease